MEYVSATVIGAAARAKSYYEAQWCTNMRASCVALLQKKKQGERGKRAGGDVGNTT
jgi:hypothetical protein